MVSHKSNAKRGVTHPLPKAKSQRVGHPKLSHRFKDAPPARATGRGRVRKESNPKPQVHTTNLGHSPGWVGLRADESFLV
jgi:hypothetical protein